MLRDVFYFGEKPNVHPREKHATSLSDARSQATTEHFWIINEFSDYRNFEWDFDFEFLPDEDVWAEQHNNVWPSQHQKDSGTWLCPKEYSSIVIYRTDVTPVKRRNIKTSNWVQLDTIDESKFDYSWHPDPSDPPYIYKWGCKFYPAQIKHVLEYHVEGATTVKYMNETVELLSNEYWLEYYPVDKEHFDYTWRPDPLDPPYIYVWGNKHVDGKVAPTIEYHTPGATERKHLPELVQLESNPSNFVHNEDSYGIDYSWIPDPTSPPYIYVWGNQWNKPEDKISIQYIVEGATEYKYMEDRAIRRPCLDNWLVPDNLDTSKFDFSWEPSPAEPAFIYEFGTQHQQTGGPKYIVPGASKTKFIETQKAIALPTQTNWKLFEDIDTTKFDFSWHPDDTAPPYIYVWGNQWNKPEDKTSVQYIVEGATEYKYMETRAVRKPCMDNWILSDNLDTSKFDFSWEPSPAEPAFIYEFGTQWQKTGGPVYVVQGASKKKYIDIQTAIALPDSSNYSVAESVKVAEFDFSWHPDATEEPYIYVFGNQWYNSITMPTVKYTVPGATQIKFVDTVVAKLAPDMTNWSVPDNLDTSKFDFSWIPDPNDPLYIYQFGTQWQKTGGPKYIVPYATEIKYVDVQRAKILPNKTNWSTPYNIELQDFDYSWHPDATEEPYVYQFGTQWQDIGGPRYTVPDATEVKYIPTDVIHAKSAPSIDKWIVPDDIDRSFDFSWHPHPEDPDYIYQFGTQWQKTGGPKYISDKKYIDLLPTKFVDGSILRAKRLQSTTNWEIPDNIDSSLFDFSWHPDDTEPPYIYQFGTVLEEIHLKDGPKYVTPGNNGEIIYAENILLEDAVALPTVVPKYYIKTTLEDLLAEHSKEVFWALRDNIDYSNFDFDWIPTKEQSYNINVFGSAESELTQTYFVDANNYFNGYTDRTYLEDKKIEEMNLSEMFIKPDMFFVDRSNPESQHRYEQLKQRFPSLQKTRFLNTWVDTITRCANRSSTELCWILNSELDYTDFDFNYYPNPWQMKMVHVFGTQWSHWGSTFIINRDTFAKDTKYIKIVEHLSNLNFVKDSKKKAKAVNCLYDVFVIDFGNKEMFKVLRTLQHKVGNRPLVDVEYAGNYLDTFKEILKQLPEKKEHYIWICSSLCNYDAFDFGYICDPFTLDQLHVFPSDNQQYGDTFLVNVNKLRELVDGMQTLEDYSWLNNKINFNKHMRVGRYPAPEIVSPGDTHTSGIDVEFDYPYVVMTTQDNINIDKIDYEPMSMWTEESKSIIVTSTGGTRIIVPKEAKDVVKKELYDYPYITKSSKLSKSKPLDIVFLSNGEKCADENYEHLLNVTRGLPNRIVRVDGVNGRVQAYHAAADASNTPWMFTVFAKLKVSNKFDWNWQPDRLQIPKHYVFYAKNPVNDLVYGHQAMIAYNKKLTLANTGKGLDFTQDDEHEVLELNSGTAMFNTDEWSTWRTSFREALKLRHDTAQISKDRLNAWLTVGNGEFAQYSLDGAKHAVEYYESVNGDFDKLKLSYDWPWLRAYFDSRYK